MIDIDSKIVHRDIFEKCFCCDIKKCKGICCVEGDSGAPLETIEAEQINKIIPLLVDRLTDDGRSVIEQKGFSMIDVEGDLTTAIFGEKGACVFTQFDENDVAYCLIERLWEEGLTDFRKPISCHLYPIRVKRYSSFDAVNYHVWDICHDAVMLGNEKNIKIFDFLKEPLIRKYGVEWYKEACIAADYLRGLEE